MKADHILQAIISISGGVLSYAMGGFDLLIKTMLALTIIDFVTGTGQAIYHGKFKARECAKGTIRKVYMYLTVALAVIIQHFLGDNIPIRETVIVFYIIYEGMSAIENIGKVIAYPAKLREIFESLNDKYE